MFIFRDEGGRGNEVAINALRDEVYGLEVELNILQSELDVTTAWMESGVNSEEASRKFREVCYRRDSVSERLGELRRRLLDLLVADL